MVSNGNHNKRPKATTNMSHNDRCRGSCLAKDYIIAWSKQQYESEIFFSDRIVCLRQYNYCCVAFYKLRFF